MRPGQSFADHCWFGYSPRAAAPTACAIRAAQHDALVELLLAEEGLQLKVKQAKEAQWLEENREALLAHNEWVRKHGTFGDRLRTWKKKHAAV